MLQGQCHCGSVSWVLAAEPEYLVSCNCSLCSRINGLWAHSTREHVVLSYEDGQVIRYIQGDGTLAVISCASCGGTTHWEGRGDNSERLAVNAAMCDRRDISHLPVRRFDGADSWQFVD